MSTEHHDVKNAVQIANERFALIAQATHDTIWDWNLRTNEIWWNENFQVMFGFPPSAIEPDISSWTNRIHPDDKARVLDDIHAVINKRISSNWQAEYRFLKADGSYAIVYDRGYTLHDENGPYRMVGSMLDITDRKKAEEQLSESEERLRMAMESTKLGTWDFNPITDELQWDHRTRELFGLSRDGLIDYGLFLQGVHPDERERVDKVVQDVFKPGSDGQYDIEFRTVGIDDKKLRWINAKGRAFFNNNGEVHRFIGTVLDITEKKVAEDELKQSNERLREALLVASTGTWKIDLKAGTDTRDASLNRILGLEARETQTPIDDSFLHIHPEDVAHMKKAMEMAISQKGVYDEECRIVLPTGEMRWLKDRGQVVLDESGNPDYIIGAAIDITEQKRKEDELKVSEERFRGLFNNSSVGMALVNLDSSLLQVNPFFEALFGYSNIELRDMKISSITHPAFVASSLAGIKRCLQGEIDQFTEEKKYLRKNGEEFWGQVSVSLVKDIESKPKHFIAIVTNIHGKKVAEESLKLQARVLESMDEGVSVSDVTGLILYTNAAEDAMFGYETGELIGKHVTVQNAYLPDENNAIVTAVMEALQSDGYWNGEWHNKKKDGTTFYTYSHITSLNLGERRVLVCVQRDITEEKKYKEFLRQSAEELENRVLERTLELKTANEQLERSNEELEQFAYITSHDLQEPLRKIKTFASRIQDELTGSGQTVALKHLEKIFLSAERMSCLIKDLLNYSRLTNEVQSFVDVDLSEIVQDVLSDLEVLVAQKKATITVESLPVVKGIRLQLNQLFFNLIGNSLKFSRPDLSPEIKVVATKLQPSEASSLGLQPVAFHRIVFQDNGIGFNPVYKEQIFEIFQRLNARDAFAGTGIGLALSKRVVQNHHGVITAQSAEGQGATFTVYLPAEE